MVREVLEALLVKPGGSYIDCTTGEAGHSLAILDTVTPTPRLLGIDLDAQARSAARKTLEPYSDSVSLVQGDYADVGTLARRYGFVEADGVLFDVGLSSLQLESPGRGFSFRHEAPLDMRFDRSQRTTADDVVNGYTERELADIVFKYGEDRKARRIARAIVRSRPIATTTELARVVAGAAGGSGRDRIHPATRTFQAVRIAVNRELDRLERGLEQAIEVLRPGGRLVVISYHSLEDRVAKTILRRESSACVCPAEAIECVCGHTPAVRLVSRKIIRPAPEEVRANPRSRSARMRVAQRV